MSEANEMDIGEIDLDDAVRPYPVASQELADLRARCEAAEKAMKVVIEWDKRRGFILPYKVRDPIHAAMAKENLKKATAGLLPKERECCGTFPKTPHRSTCAKYRGKPRNNKG